MTGANLIDAPSTFPNRYGGACIKVSNVTVIPIGHVQLTIELSPTKSRGGVRNASLIISHDDVFRLWIFGSRVLPMPKIVLTLLVC